MKCAYLISPFLYITNGSFVKKGLRTKQTKIFMYGPHSLRGYPLSNFVNVFDGRFGTRSRE